MHLSEERLMLIKPVVTALLGMGSGLLAVASDNQTVAYGSIGVTLVAFAGLIFNNVVRTQKAVWAIVREKDAELTRKDHRIRFIEWEREAARFRAGERGDPGTAPTEVTA